MRKGIILAGGTGARLYPATKAISKQLQIIYDKPMLYYPLSILLLAKVREILIISTPNDLPLIKRLFPDNGKNLGCEIQFAVQQEPKGIAQSLLIAENFLNQSPCILILGDNIFHGMGLPDLLHNADKRLLENESSVFTYMVNNPSQYGILTHNKSGNPIEIVEKPTNPTSHSAVTGLYYYDSEAVQIAKQIQPSSRGELEITAINNCYLKHGRLKIQQLGRGMAWFDTGTIDSLLDASNYIASIERRQGIKVACLEEIAWRNNWISLETLEKLGQQLVKSSYGQYILSLCKQSTTECRQPTYSYE